MPSKTDRTIELKGLYANSNRFTVPKGSVPRMSNQYMIRRGAFHTVPGSKWITSWDGLPPHATNRPQIVALQWFSPSSGSGPAAYMGSAGDFVIAIEKASATTAEITNVTTPPLFQLLTTISLPIGPIVDTIQFGDYLIVAFGNSTPPTIFPVYTQVALAVLTGDTSINVLDTTAFAPVGLIKIDTEYIQYSGITPTAFTGCSRGQFGTGSNPHAIGAGVATPSGGSPGTQLHLSQAIDNSQTTGIRFNRTLTPPSIAGAILVDSEVFTYTGYDNTNMFLGVTRGTNGTAAAAHHFGAILQPDNGGTPGTSVWNALRNQFDPSNVYGSWPGTQGASSATATAAVNIGTLIYAKDPGGTPWLFRAQNSGVTAYGASYNGPNFFPSGTGIYGQSAKDFNPANNSGTVVWLNVGQAALPPPGAAFVFQHLDTLFLWGVGNDYGSDGITGPDALWESDIGAPQTFNPANTTFVGKGDGSTAQGGCVYSLSEAGIAATPQLVLFKDASTYSFLNSFQNNPSLVPVSGGLGCIAPKSIQFIGGYGVMRLTYAGFALFDGQLEHVTEYTDAIRGYLFGGLPDITQIDLAFIQQSVSFQSTNPNMYWCFCPLAFQAGVITRGFGYDFALKQWCVIDLPFPITAAAFNPQASFVATQLQSLVGGANDGAIRSMFFGAPDWDGVPITSSITLPEMGYPATPIYLDAINLRLTADGGGAEPSIAGLNFTGTKRSGRNFTRPCRLPRSILSNITIGELVLSGSLQITMQGQILIEGYEAITVDLPTARVGT